ncbi:GAF domain-containing protein, partial [Singulisphaera rosea]
MNRHAAPIDHVVITEELARRPRRLPDFGAENLALVGLAEVMAESPKAILQRLSDAVLELCRTDSAGISIEEAEGRNPVFRWRATSGAYDKYVGETMPRGFSPCGVVLDRNAPVLMADPVGCYGYIAALDPPVREVLLVPFYRGQVPIGTIWAVAHTEEKRFDSEDVRLLESLARFASAAVRTLENLEAIEAGDRDLRDTRTRL